MSSGDELNQLLIKSSIPSNSEEARKLIAYLALLEKWNSRINLTSKTDWAVIGPMFREAIWVQRLYPPEAITHLDIGSGAGFPALPLKILIPRINLDLVDSREKKIQFLETVAHALGISGISAHHSLLSDYLRKGCRTKWDCISWKALKISPKDLLQIHAHTHANSQLWMFHGERLALKEPDSMENGFKLLKSERIPGTQDAQLSIYCPIH